MEETHTTSGTAMKDHTIIWTTVTVSQNHVGMHNSNRTIVA